MIVHAPMICDVFYRRSATDSSPVSPQMSWNMSRNFTDDKSNASNWNRRKFSDWNYCTSLYCLEKRPNRKRPWDFQGLVSIAQIFIHSISYVSPLANCNNYFSQKKKRSQETFFSNSSEINSGKKKVCLENDLRNKKWWTGKNETEKKVSQYKVVLLSWPLMQRTMVQAWRSLSKAYEGSLITKGIVQKAIQSHSIHSLSTAFSISPSIIKSPSK